MANQAYSLEDIIYQMEGDDHVKFDAQVASDIDTSDQDKDIFDDNKFDNKDDKSDEIDDVRLNDEEDIDSDTDDTDDDEGDDTDDSTDDSVDDSESSDDNTSSDDDSQTNPFFAIFDIMKEEKAFTVEEDFEFDGTPQSFLDVWKQNEANLAQEVSKSLWQQMPEHLQDIVMYGVNGGEDLNSLIRSKAEQLDLKKVDITKLEDQRRIVRNFMEKTTKFSGDRITKHIDRLEVAELLEEEAGSALPELEKILDQEVKAQAQAQETARNEQIKAVEDFRRDIASRIKESKDIDKSQKSKLQAFMFNELDRGDGVISTGFGHVLSQATQNPEHFLQLGQLAFEYDSEKGFVSKTLSKKAKTQSAKSLQKRLDEITSGKSKMRGGKTDAPGSKASTGLWDWILHSTEK